MTRAKVSLSLFSLASILSFLAALIPVLKGGRLNVVYLGTGVVMLVLAISAAKKVRADGGVPPAP